MAWSNLTIYLNGSNFAATNITATKTLTTTDLGDAQQFIQNLVKQGGVWADNGLYYPVDCIMALQIQ